MESDRGWRGPEKICHLTGAMWRGCPSSFLTHSLPHCQPFRSSVDCSRHLAFCAPLSLSSLYSSLFFPSAFFHSFWPLFFSFAPSMRSTYFRSHFLFLPRILKGRHSSASAHWVVTACDAHREKESAETSSASSPPSSSILQVQQR